MARYLYCNEEQGNVVNTFTLACILSPTKEDDVSPTRRKKQCLINPTTKTKEEHKIKMFARTTS